MQQSMFQDDFNQSFTDSIKNQPSRCKNCLNQKLDLQLLLQKLTQILHTLQQQISNKTKEMQALKKHYERELNIKDEVIQRLARANDKLSQQNIEIRKQLQKQKQANSSMIINIHEVNKSKGNISDLMTVDNSFRNKAQTINESIRSLEKEIRKVSKNIGGFNRYQFNAYRNFNLENIERVKFATQNIMRRREEDGLKRIRSSAFIGKKSYDYLNILPQKRFVHHKTSIDNEQSFTHYTAYRTYISTSNLLSKNNVGAYFQEKH